MGNAPACAREALDMVRAGLGYLAAADATRLAAATQAECLRELEQAGAVATAARAAVLAAFTAGQGYAGDAEYGAVSWLMHRTGITRGAAVGHAAWAGRTRTHPKVVAALAAGQVPESVGRLICLWTSRLPEKFRDESDELLLAAAAGGLGLEELASLVAQMYERARGDCRMRTRIRAGTSADRALKLAVTFGGAGVVHGDLTAECAAAVAAVLDALSAPAGKDDDRTKDQRYHDALAEAMRRLVAGGPAAGAGRAAGQGLGAYFAGGPAPARRQLGAAGAVDRAGPGPVGGAPRAGVRDRRERRGLARGGRRRGDRLRRGDGAGRDRGPGPRRLDRAGAGGIELAQQGQGLLSHGLLDERELAHLLRAEGVAQPGGLGVDAAAASGFGQQCCAAGSGSARRLRPGWERRPGRRGPRAG